MIGARHERREEGKEEAATVALEFRRNSGAVEHQQNPRADATGRWVAVKTRRKKNSEKMDVVHSVIGQTTPYGLRSQYCKVYFGCDQPATHGSACHCAQIFDGEEASLNPKAWPIQDRPVIYTILVDYMNTQQI